MSRTHSELIQSELADMAREMNALIDNVIGAVPSGYSDEFQSECFRDALKLARGHRLNLEALSRRVGEWLQAKDVEQAAQRDLDVLKQAAAQREGGAT